MSPKKRILVLTGPTASGKSACAVALCHILPGEVISADSMQLYRGMDILSAVPTAVERQGVPHHLLGVLEPDKRCTASLYRELAAQVVEEVCRRGVTPAVCGGSGLYIDALVTASSFSVQSDPELHASLYAVSEEPGGLEKLHTMLADCDPVAAERLHKNDVRRVVRALEIYQLTGMTQTEFIERDKQAEKTYDERIFALEWPRDVLYKRIDDRVDEMVEAGLFREVERLLDTYRDFPTAGQAIGFREVAYVLAGNMTREEGIGRMKQATRNYAKRQITWIKRLQGVIRISAQDRSPEDIAGQISDMVR